MYYYNLIRYLVIEIWLNGKRSGVELHKIIVSRVDFGTCFKERIRKSKGKNEKRRKLIKCSLFKI